MSGPRDPAPREPGVENLPREEPGDEPVRHRPDYGPDPDYPPPEREIPSDPVPDDGTPPPDR